MEPDKNGIWFDPRKLIKPRGSHIETETQNSIFALLEAILNSRNEEEVLRSGIEYLVEYCALAGASFIPFNEMKAIAPPIFIGEIGDPKLFKLDNYIDLVDLRQECKRCVDLQSDGQCVLLADGTTFQIRCFNLLIDGKKEGVVNLYWLKNRHLEDHQVQVIERVIAILERGVRQISFVDHAQHQNTHPEDAAKNLNVFDVIERSIKKVCELHQIEEVIGYFPEGFKDPGQKLVQIVSSARQSTAKEGYSEMMGGLWKVIQNTGETVFLENKNTDNGWLQLLAIPVCEKEERDPPPSGMIVLLTKRNSLGEIQNDATLRVIFEQVGFILLKERAFETAYERSMIDERIRLSREIHDGIAQTLAFLMIQMKRMWRFYQQHETEKFTEVYDESYQIVSETYGDLRDAIHDLRRTPETDLIETIKELCVDFEAKAGIATLVELEPIEGHSGSQFQLHMIRIIQEALSNIRKHSQATNVRVIGGSHKSGYRIQIFDDGVGFDTDEQNIDRSHHFGLTSIHERARILGITEKIQSTPGQGTCLELLI